MAQSTPVRPGQSRWIWPFELLEQIGEGGMGMVYRARYVVNNREVAVKMLPTDVTDKTALARFEREMEVLKNLKHPNIVRCFGGACEDKQRFYAMELVEGGTLEDVLQQRGRLSWELVVEYGLQMCAALECSHRHGVVHRDVKPANFLIAANGQLKLSDFGLASVVAQRRITHAGKTAGTFLYMAPEQIRGGDVTPRTDLYALGCVLFELLTGRPPFVGDTPAATLHMHCKQAPPRVAEVAPDCPAMLERLILQMMAKEPAERPESASDVARELRAVTQTVLVVTPPRSISLASVAGSRPVTASDEGADTALGPAVRAPGRASPPPWAVLLLAVVAAGSLIGNVLLWNSRSAAREWEQAWVESLRHADVSVRVAAARGLGTVADPGTAPLQALVDGLESPDAAFRAACAAGLGEIGAASRAHLAVLMRVQKDDADANVRMAAAGAVQKIKVARGGGAIGTVLLMLLIVAALGGAAFWYRQSSQAPAPRPPQG